MELNSGLSASEKQQQNPSSALAPSRPPPCVTGIEYIPGLDCQTCHCPFANQVEGKLETHFRYSKDDKTVAFELKNVFGSV